MSAPAQTSSGQAPDAGQPQAGTSTQPQDGGESTTGLSPEALSAELARARREAAGYRSRLTTLEKQQQDADAAKLSDLEKAQREAAAIKAELEAERLDRRVAMNRYEAQLAASKLGVIDPSDIVRLLDWDALEYDEAGAPKGVEKAIQALLKAKPYLAGQQATGNGNQAAPLTGANPGNAARTNGEAPLTLKDLKGKSPGWINDPRNWPRVQEAMRSGR